MYVFKKASQDKSINYVYIIYVYSPTCIVRIVYKCMRTSIHAHSQYTDKKETMTLHLLQHWEDRRLGSLEVVYQHENVRVGREGLLRSICNPTTLHGV